MSSICPKDPSIKSVRDVLSANKSRINRACQTESGQSAAHIVPDIQKNRCIAAEYDEECAQISLLHARAGMPIKKTSLLELLGRCVQRYHLSRPM